MINPFEKSNIINSIFLILIAAEIFFVSSMPGEGLGTGISFAPIAYHFIVFFLFGFFSLNLIKGMRKLKASYIVISLIISLAYASLDEFHQLFVQGRSCSFGDFLIDSFGIITSTIIIIFFSLQKKHSTD